MLTLANFLVLLCKFFINKRAWITSRLLKMFLYSEVSVNSMVCILHNTILIFMYYAPGYSSWIMYKCKEDTGFHHKYSYSLEVKWLTQFGQLCNCVVIQFSLNGCCPQQTLFNVSAFYIPWLCTTVIFFLNMKHKCKKKKKKKKKKNILFL